MSLRPVAPSDGQAIADLLARSADAGAFQVSSRFKIDPWRALSAIHGEFDGVVASRFWYRPGAERAAVRLWEVVRWEWRARGSTFLLWSDPLAPLAHLLKPRSGCRSRPGPSPPSRWTKSASSTP